MSFFFSSVLSSLFIFTFFASVLFTFSSRFTKLVSFSWSLIRTVVNSYIAKGLLCYLFFVLLVVNVLGNAPLNIIPTMFYRSTFTLRLLFWVPLIIAVTIRDFRSFTAHLLPYGSPVGLMLLLPLIEIFSQLIRPLTLMIRLRTNLSSGHIMIYIFSYFTLLSSILSPFLYAVLACLFVLELCISALQAYIFVSLLALYVSETLWLLGRIICVRVKS